MLADSAQKYINSSASLAAAAAATEHAQLQAARPLLRTLAAAAVAQLRSCMALLGAGGEAGNGGAILTHTSSLRACCLLLRAVLGLMGEALDPLLLQPGGALPGGPLGPHVLHMLALELPPNQLVDAQQAYIALHQVAAQHAANAMAAEGPAGGAPGQPQQQALPQEQPQGEQGDPLIQALAAQPPSPPTPAFAAAAAAAGLPLREPLPGAVQEALAADAIVLLQAGGCRGACSACTCLLVASPSRAALRAASTVCAGCAVGSAGHWMASKPCFAALLMAALSGGPHPHCFRLLRWRWSCRTPRCARCRCCA